MCCWLIARTNIFGSLDLRSICSINGCRVSEIFCHIKLYLMKINNDRSKIDLMMHRLPMSLRKYAACSCCWYAMYIVLLATCLITCSIDTIDNLPCIFTETAYFLNVSQLMCFARITVLVNVNLEQGDYVLSFSVKFWVRLSHSYLPLLYVGLVHIPSKYRPIFLSESASQNGCQRCPEFTFESG